MAKQYLYIVSGADQKYHYQQALNVLSGIYQEDNDWDKANEINEKLLQITLSGKRQQLILLELIVGNYNTEDYTKSLTFIEEIFTTEETLIYAFNKASLYKGLVYYRQKKLEEAKDEFVLLSNNAKDIYAAEAHFMVGQVLYDQDKYLESIESLKSLLNTRGDFSKWYGEGYVLAAMCYVNLGQTFQGKSYLKDIVTNYPDKSVAEHAQKYLDEIENEEVEE